MFVKYTMYPPLETEMTGLLGYMYVYVLFSFFMLVCKETCKVRSTRDTLFLYMFRGKGPSLRVFLPTNYASFRTWVVSRHDRLSL